MEVFKVQFTLACVVIASAIEAALGGATIEVCGAKLQKLGCFRDRHASRILPDMIMTDRDRSSIVFSGTQMNWPKTFQPYLKSIACRCARKAEAKGYEIFGLQYYSECWSGVVTNALRYDTYGSSDKCLPEYTKNCDDNSTEICMGRASTNYIYRFAPAPCSAEDVVNAIMNAVPAGSAKVNNRVLTAAIQIAKAIENKVPKDMPVTREQLKARIKRVVATSGVEFGREMLGVMLQREENCSRDINDIIKEIHDNMGDKAFKDFLAVNGNVSLIFVVDTTGSMTAEITAAKNTIRALTGYKRSEAVDYILSPYNDPDSGPVTTYNQSHINEFKKAVSHLYAYGGYDCPELTFNGIINAIRQGKPKQGSPIFVFTDAPAKPDGEYTRDAVIATALEYMIPVNFFFNPEGCSTPGKDLDYQAITAGTGGSSWMFNSASDISSTAVGFVEADLDGSTIIATGEAPAGTRKRSPLGVVPHTKAAVVEFSVDDSIDKLVISIEASKFWHHIKVFDPSSVWMPATLNMNNGMVWFYEGDAVKTGRWRIQVPSLVVGFSYQASKQYSSGVKGSSLVNNMFDVVFLKKTRSGKVTIANPLLGETSMVKVILPQGSRLEHSSLRLEVTHSGSGTAIALNDKLEGEFSPSAAFRLVLFAMTRTGHRLQRVSREMRATSAVLRAKISNDLLVLNKSWMSLQHFVLYNNGKTEQFTFQAKVSSERVSVETPGPMTVREKGEKSGIVKFSRCDLDSGATVTLSVIATGKSSGVITTMTMHLMVA
ncbi:predicted protein [Nematostella vectensis]|uniref:Hemicentin-1-like von Willebrand factor A domain-containing protein n=2 Tax=Nematostella vectensis TaxID=45351 RepID=A7S0M0_NEMVE|nr:predicted protein [Nematostella vectensis]|eukprot:XP_001634823.1 predicted protein [Nematostella vectensis]